MVIDRNLNPRIHHVMRLLLDMIEAKAASLSTDDDEELEQAYEDLGAVTPEIEIQMDRAAYAVACGQERLPSQT